MIPIGELASTVLNGLTATLLEQKGNGARMTEDAEAEILAWETAMLAQIDRLKAALATARTDALEEAAALCDKREETWGTATIRWESNTLARQIRALKDSP